MQDLKALVRSEAEAAGLVGRRVLVAVSGGPDSVALFDILSQVARDVPIGLHLCHIDHGWRPTDAAAEAAMCRDLAEAAGVGWSVVHLPAPAVANEEAAREARRFVLLRVARAVGAQAVALGHQADDQAETVLMQLVRGTGSAGGMAVWRPPLWRPLLSVERSTLLDYCRDRQLAFASDQTNLSTAFRRNRVRLELMPVLRRENPRAVQALGRFAALRREEDAWLDQEAAAIVRSLPRLSHGVDLRPLLRYPPPLQRRALRQVLADRGASLGAERLMELQRVLWAGGRLSPRPDLRLERGLLVWPAPRLPWCSLVPGSRLCWGGLRFGVGRPPADAAAAEVGPGRLTVRTRRPGDRLRLAGGSRKLQDILVDAGVPRPLRDLLPVVCRDGQPVWLPGHVRAVDAGVGCTVWAGSGEVVAQLWSVLE